MKQIGIALGVLASAALSQSQTLPQVYPTALGSSGNPWGSATSQRAQYAYDSAQFAVQAPILITQIYVRPLNPLLTSPPVTWANLEVKLSSCTTNFNTLSTTFLANQGPDVVTARTGPFTSAPITASTSATANWFQLTLTTPFAFNPALGKDLLVDVAKCGGAIPGFNMDCDASSVSTGAVRATASCTALTGAAMIFLPFLKIDYQPIAPPQFQVNQPSSSFDIDGANGTAFVLANPKACVGNTATANIASTEINQGWDILIGGAPIKSASQGAPATLGGQLVNVDLADPTLTFLNNLSLIPNFSPLSIPVGITVPFSLSLQQFNISPTNPDGLALSAPSRFEATPLGTTLTYGQAVLPDDGWLGLPFSALPQLPTCASPIPNITFWGTVYTGAFVCTNGRVMFDNGLITAAMLQDWTPTAATALQGPFAGFWADLEPNNTPGAQLVIDWTAGNVVTMTYTNHRYWGLASNIGVGSATMAFDIATGGVTLSGLSSIGPHLAGTTNMFLGVSKGPGATDPGQTAFVAGNSGSMGAGTDMVYQLGLEGTLAAGVASLVFTPNMLQGGYSWAAF